jgi:hypothetical protein
MIYGCENSFYRNVGRYLRIGFMGLMMGFVYSHRAADDFAALTVKALCLLFTIAFVFSERFGGFKKGALFLGVGVLSVVIGYIYSHNAAGYVAVNIPLEIGHRFH